MALLTDDTFPGGQSTTVRGSFFSLSFFFSHSARRALRGARLWSGVVGHNNLFHVRTSPSL